MKEENINAQERLAIISEVITNTKSRFERNGKIFLFWGILLTLASAAQFILLQLEYYEINYYPYFFAILGWVYMFWYYSKSENRIKSKNIISKTINSIWIFVGINCALLGFLLASELRNHLIPVILIIVSAGVLVTGTAIRDRVLLIGGIICNIAGIVAFFIGYEYQPLLTSIVYFAVLVVPGYLLSRNYKRRHAA